MASFVGRDRGFRHLSFSPSDGVPLHEAPTLAAAELDSRAVNSPLRDWLLVVDADDRPLGWTGAPDGLEDLVPGGSLFRPGDTLRRALDAALSSPSGLGVAVDAEGRVAGVIKGTEVLALIESARRIRQGAL